MRRTIGLCTLGAVLGVVALVYGTSPAAADDVPYTDSAQVGYIGFCDATGHSVDSGSLDAIPFVAKVVSSVAAPAPYNGPGRIAFLDAYQPRAGLTPPEWSGEQLIAVSTYSTPAHPTVVGTKGDISLRQFIDDYPPSWDGLVQLRLYLKTPDRPYDALHYAATDLEIDGDSWHVARGGGVACDAGKGRSLSAQLAPQAAAGKLNSADNPSPARVSGPAQAAATGARNSTPAGGSTGTRQAPSAVAGDAAGGSSSGGGSFPLGYAVLGGLVAVLAAALLASRWRDLRSMLSRRSGTRA